MNRILSAAVLMAIVIPVRAATDFIDTAPVISSTPIIEHINEPRQECSPAAAPAAAQTRSMTGVVLGTLAGGLLGAQVGRGSGQIAAAAVGAAVGAVSGDRVQNQQRTAAAPSQQCRTVSVAREVVKGYTVVYHYGGRDVTVMLPYDPGPTVRVGVGIIDHAPVAGAPTADVLGSNVREIRPAPAYEPVAAPDNTSSAGGYQYRY
jgi:uncharacterized protein YcfJ